MNRKHITGAALVTALALPGVAQAHVTLQPDHVTAGAFTVQSVRVPNERDDAVTTKVDVQLPSGFASVSYQATPGWSVRVAKERLAQPIQTDDGPVTEEVRRITWTAGSRAEGIQPGQFRDFPLSLRIPDRAGAALTFKALQTYSDGEIVRWIGPPDGDTPAPRVTVQAAGEPSTDHTTTAASAPVVASTTAAASKALGVTALIVAILAALLGAAGLVRRRA